MARTSRKQAFFVPETKNSAIKIALYVRLSNEDNGASCIIKNVDVEN